MVSSKMVFGSKKKEEKKEKKEEKKEKKEMWNIFHLKTFSVGILCAIKLLPWVPNKKEEEEEEKSLFGGVGMVVWNH